MTELSALSPAETMLLIKNNVRKKDLLKYTLMDLLLRGVLKIDTFTKQPSARSSMTYTIKYIVPGKNIKSAELKAHEQIFVDVFNQARAIKVQFKKFVRVLHEKSKSDASYRTLISKNRLVNRYFSHSFIQKILRNRKLNTEGEKFREELLTKLGYADQNLNDLLAKNDPEAAQILLSLGGNIFLLENIDFSLLKSFDKTILSEKVKRLYQKSEFDDHDNYFLFAFDEIEAENRFFDDFNTTIDSFSDYDSYDFSDSSDYSHGCSSCSGCSGCGGCGGCS